MCTLPRPTLKIQIHMGSVGIFPFKQTPQFSWSWTGGCNMVIGTRGDLNKGGQKHCLKRTVPGKIWRRGPYIPSEGRSNMTTLFLWEKHTLTVWHYPRTKPAATCAQFHLADLPAFQELPSKDFLSAIFHIQSPWFSCPERRTLHGEHPFNPTHCSWLVLGEKWMALLGISPGISADKQMKLSKGKAINIVWNKISVFNLICFQLILKLESHPGVC